MSALVHKQPSDVAKMGTALARVSQTPGLPLNPGSLPRTLIIVRMLAGASEADTLLAHLLALPGELPAVAHCGGPAGPSFKAQDQSLTLRLDADDPDLTSSVFDFRLAHGTRHMIASFDPECTRSALQLLEDLALSRIPVDLIFVTSRNEAVPKFVTRLEDAGSQVIQAHKASLRTEDPADFLVYPGISPQLESVYASGSLSLRKIVESSSLGIQLAFERNLTAFASSLRSQIHG